MHRTRFALKGMLYTALVLALLVAPLPGTNLVRPAHAKDDVAINISEDMGMEDFLRALGNVTGQALVWNPADKNIRGKKIIGGVNLKGTAEEVFALARSLLTFYELVMIPVGPTGKDVVLIMDARQTSSILKLKPEHVVLNDHNLGKYENADGLFITTTIRVENMGDLRNARNALTRIVTGQNIGNVTEVPAANAFVVTDFAPNVVAIYRLLKEMDVPSTQSSTTMGKTEAIQLEHAEAMELAAVLQSHYAAVPKRPVSPRVQQQPQPSSPRAPRITAEPRTNKVLITGSDAQIEAVKRVIATLDVQIHKPNLRAHFVSLKNIEAPQAASALSIFINSSSALWAAGSVVPGVVAHAETNSLLISSDKRGFEELSRLIEQMDKAKAEK